MKRKHDPSWYPSEGQQHTRAIIALAAVDYALAMYAEDTDGPLAERFRKIRRWLDVCSEQARARHDSAATRRRLRAFGEQLEVWRGSIPKRPARIVSRWGAHVLMALEFLGDVRNTSPIFWDAPGYSRAWRYLGQTTETLGEAIRNKYPGAWRLGFEMYLRLWDEMEEAA